MSFSTYYKFEGELPHCAKTDLKSYYEEAQETIDQLWKKLTILAAMPPMESITNSDGNKVNWPEFIEDEMTQIKSELNAAYWRLNHYGDAINAEEENPKNIHDDDDEWDEEKQQWVSEDL